MVGGRDRLACQAQDLTHRIRPQASLLLVYSQFDQAGLSVFSTRLEGRLELFEVPTLRKQHVITAKGGSSQISVEKQAQVPKWQGT